MMTKKLTGKRSTILVDTNSLSGILPLQLVIIFMAYILAFYVSLSAAMPWCFIDNCEDEERTEQSMASGEDNCTNCSPFSLCAFCPGFTLISVYTVIQPVVCNISTAYSEYNFSPQSEYHSALFQPPRVA